MSKMEDGNSAALRQHEAREARAESKYEAWGERARESIVDDLMDGRKVGRTTLYDILDGHHDLLDTGDFAALAINWPNVRDDTMARLEKRCRELCNDWLETAAGQDAVNELVNVMDEDARSGV
jgi:hypothetical protein